MGENLWVDRRNPPKDGVNRWSEWTRTVCGLMGIDKEMRGMSERDEGAVAMESVLKRWDWGILTLGVDEIALLGFSKVRSPKSI